LFCQKFGVKRSVPSEPVAGLGNQKGVKLKNWVSVCATGLGLGKIPAAPGTFGTLLGIPLSFLFYLTGPIGYTILTFVFILFSIYVAEAYRVQSGTEDPKEVVIDEVAGFLVAMAMLPWTYTWVFLAFVIFRIFDALKPPPIRQLDKNVKGGFGIVVDDLVAGLITSVILQMVYQNNWLENLMSSWSGS
jgi:phosphatidylglycerophosphatase A